MITSYFTLSKYRTAIFLVLALPLLYFISRYNYLLFHSLADGVSIVIAATVFTIILNGRRIVDNDYFLYVGIAFLFFAFWDLMHLLGNKNMGVFPEYGNLGPALYIVSRYILSVSLIIGPLFINRKLNTTLMFAVYSLVTLLILLSIFYWQLFPVCIVEGVGLTPFKVVSDYIICLILLGAIGLLFINRRSFDSRVLWLILSSLILSIATGLAFTLYADPFGIMNAVGHFLQIASFYLFYLAFIETSLTKPQDILYRKLKRNEEILSANSEQLNAANTELKQEIAERNKTEAALRESEAKFRTIIDVSPVPYALNDDKGNITFLNKAFIRAFGYTLEDIPTLAEWWPKVYPDPDYRRWVATTWQTHLEKAKREGTAFEPIELSIKCKGGLTRTAIVSAAALDESFEGTHLVILYDITERKRTEEELRGSEERYRSLVENASDIVFRLDDTGHITFVNPAALRIMEYEEKEIIGRHYPTFIRPDMREEAMKFFGRQFVKGIPNTYSEYPVIVKDGREIWFGQNTQLIFQDGKVVAFQAVARDITERKRTEEELRRNQDVSERLAQEIAIIAEIGKVIGSTLDIEEVYENFAAEVRKLIPFDRLAVNLHNLHEENVRVAYVFGEAISGRSKGALFPLKGSISEILTKTRAGLFSHPKNVEEMGKHFPNHVATFQAGMRSLMGVPLIYRDEVIGSLHFRSKTPNTYTDRDLRLAERIALQIAGAIGSAKLFSDRKRLEEENERRSKQMAALHDIGIELTAEFNLEALFQSIAQRSLDLVGGTTSNVYIYRPEEDLMERAVSVGQTLIPSKTTRRRGEGMVGQTWEKGGPMLINDYHSWPGRTKTIDSYPSRALIAVPFRQGTEIIGVINIMANLPHQYTQADVDMLDLFATQAAIAIRNAQLYDRIKLELVERKRAEEKERRNREAAERLAGEMAVIAEIGRLIGSTLDIEEVYERFAAETRKLIPFDRVSVNLMNPDGKSFTNAYVSGLDVPDRRPGTIVPLAGSVSEIFMQSQSGRIIHVESPENLVRQFPGVTVSMVVQAGIRSLLGVPLISRDEVIGVLHFRSINPNIYTEQDLRLAEKIAAQIAGAIANGQLFTDRKRMEEEIREMSLRDQMTDLYNRRGFITLAEQQIRAADRAKRPMLLTFIDLDGLKGINDTLGHEEGDRALIDAANVLRQTFRESDVIARLGGDEFAVLSIDAADMNPEDLSKRLQENIDAGNAKETRPYKMAMSWGTVVYDPGFPLSFDELMSLADERMYAQKKVKSNRRI